MVEMRIVANMDETKEEFFRFSFCLCLTRSLVGKQPSHVIFTHFIVKYLRI
jgi:hypothetical protein